MSVFLFILVFPRQSYQAIENTLCSSASARECIEIDRPQLGTPTENATVETDNKRYTELLFSRRRALKYPVGGTGRSRPPR